MRQRRHDDARGLTLPTLPRSTSLDCDGVVVESRRRRGAAVGMEMADVDEKVGVAAARHPLVTAASARRTTSLDRDIVRSRCGVREGRARVCVVVALWIR